MKQLTKIMLLILMVSGLLSGCSQNKKHKMLSFFFDGVQHADSSRTEGHGTGDKAKATGKADQQPVSVPRYHFHAVYEQKECSACHDNENANKLVQEVPDLCFQCHPDFSEEYQSVHVPVAMGECLACHHPHMAPNEKLLIVDVQELCFTCHAEEDLCETETHSEIGETSCTDCHNPHGGEDEYMLN